MKLLTIAAAWAVLGSESHAVLPQTESAHDALPTLRVDPWCVTTDDAMQPRPPSWQRLSHTDEQGSNDFLSFAGCTAVTAAEHIYYLGGRRKDRCIACLGGAASPAGKASNSITWLVQEPGGVVCGVQPVHHCHWHMAHVAQAPSSSGVSGGSGGWHRNLVFGRCGGRTGDPETTAHGVQHSAQGLAVAPDKVSSSRPRAVQVPFWLIALKGQGSRTCVPVDARCQGCAQAVLSCHTILAGLCLPYELQSQVLREGHSAPDESTLLSAGVTCSFWPAQRMRQ